MAGPFKIETASDRRKKMKGRKHIKEDIIKALREVVVPELNNLGYEGNEVIGQLNERKGFGEANTIDHIAEVLDSSSEVGAKTSFQIGVTFNRKTIKKMETGLTDRLSKYGEFKVNITMRGGIATFTIKRDAPKTSSVNF